MIGNPVPTLLGDVYFYLHLRNSKGGGTIVCCVSLLYKWFISHLSQTHAFVENKQCLQWSQRLMSLTNDDIVWYDSALGILEIIDSRGEFSNVPLIGTQGGINYNHALARRQLGFPLRDNPNNTQLEGLFYQEVKDPQHLKQKMLHAWYKVHRNGRSEHGSRNCVALEAYTLWVKKNSLELKMPYACERPMSWGPPSSSIPQYSGAWKKIVDQLVLEKAQMKTSFESEIRRIRRKYAPASRSSDIVVRGSLG
ncbi:hypothetical protein KIW84_022882 [Lathyrus oleraceus]|uniref:DUF7745 domain-containing protein n=1 Tax=Pisum sativum TaxID=3888 RepID=A0A9D5BAI4_PEA|nr:hypothetical protein KIW84_022882 [Pisum sativum]